jgi:hypothetical protein
MNKILLFLSALCLLLSLGDSFRQLSPQIFADRPIMGLKCGLSTSRKSCNSKYYMATADHSYEQQQKHDFMRIIAAMTSKSKKLVRFSLPSFLFFLF